MPWSEEWELEGLFWLPDDDRRFYGRLRHEPDHGTQLHFVASPLAGSRDRSEPNWFVDALHGETVDGHALSLLGVYLTRVAGGTNNVVDAMTMHVVAGFPHLRDLATTQVKRLAVDYYGFTEAFVGAWPYGGGILHPREVSSGRYDALNVQIDDAVALRIEAGEMRNIVRGKEEPKEYGQAVFEFDSARPYEQLETRYVEPLRDFIALTTRRQSYVTRCSLAPDDDALGWKLASVPYPRPAERWQRKVAALAVDLSQAEDPAGILRRWFELRERVGPVWTTFFAAVYATTLLDDQFLSLAAFAEGYHRALHDRPPLPKAEDRRIQRAMLGAVDDVKLRRFYRERLGHANAQSQRERLIDLTSRAGELLGWDLDVEQTVAQIVATRNWMVHWGRRSLAAVDDTADLARLARQLELVIHVNLLIDVGLDANAVRASVGSGWRFGGLP